MLMEGASVTDLDRLTASVLGREVEVSGMPGETVELSLLLGDHSVVDVAVGGSGGCTGG